MSHARMLKVFGMSTSARGRIRGCGRCLGILDARSQVFSFRDPYISLGICAENFAHIAYERTNIKEHWLLFGCGSGALGRTRAVTSGYRCSLHDSASAYVYLQLFSQILIRCLILMRATSDLDEGRIIWLPPRKMVLRQYGKRSALTCSLAKLGCSMAEVVLGIQRLAWSVSIRLYYDRRVRAGQVLRINAGRFRSINHIASPTFGFICISATLNVMPLSVAIADNL